MSFLLLEINLLLKFDFLLKYEAYPIKLTSDTWCFAGLYLPCWSFQRLRWSTAVWCRWRNLKPVHVIRKILWKTESAMIGKIVTFWRVKMQIWVIYCILLVIECCGTLGTAVNEAYFALFSMGAHGTGMTPLVYWNYTRHLLSLFLTLFPSKISELVHSELAQS